MNHRHHWRIDPLYNPRPNDNRLWRCVVRKGPWGFEDMGSFYWVLPRKWEVHLQARNSQHNNWSTEEKYIYDEFENALTFATIFNKKRKWP